MCYIFWSLFLFICFHLVCGLHPLLPFLSILLMPLLLLVYAPFQQTRIILNLHPSCSTCCWFSWMLLRDNLTFLRIFHCFLQFLCAFKGLELRKFPLLLSMLFLIPKFDMNNASSLEASATSFSTLSAELLADFFSSETLSLLRFFYWSRCWSSSNVTFRSLLS